MHVPTLICLLLFWTGASLPGWKAADRYADTHRSTWGGVFASLDVEARLCEALVFPELVRYKRVVDAVQQAALGARYVQGGETACNYSIGIFQMKPSFAREVEEAWMATEGPGRYGLYFDLRDGPELRRRRMDRLMDPEWQCVYLALFVRLLLDREPALAASDPETRLLHLATAYNLSFTATWEARLSALRRKTFHTHLLPSPRTRYHNYASLALRRYRELGQ